MSGDSEAMSECTPSVHISSDDDLTSQSRLEYMPEGLSNPHSEESSPSGWRLREIVIPDDWSVPDFLVDMSDEVFNRLRPRFQIPDDVPIRKGDKGEKCYTMSTSDVGLYETAFIVGFRLPLSSLHRQLAT